MRFRAWVIGFAAAAATATAGAAEKEHAFVGVDKCGRCHEKELYGDQISAWRKSAHARAFETLGSAKAAELAKQRGISGSPQQADECLVCHVTAHGVDARQIKYELDPKDGVQCESCHGAGADYRSRSVMSNRDKAVAKGLVVQAETVCATCHNSKSPTWDPAVGFDYEKAKAKIAHPTPAGVRGHVAEKDRDDE